MKKMLDKQLKGVPEDQKEKIITAISKNPQLFQKIGKEVQEEMKAGKDQMQSTMSVMHKYQSELKDLL
ncbi:MAG: hypothetical protein MRY49_01200 [Candidatus Pacebacteria bacterium]|nr:hypothetical protein [Candidatus Paceibacterota bacterium]